MKIEKVINNNVVTAIDEAGQEVVLMGKGIGFQVKTGAQIAKDVVEKKFVLSNQDEIGKFQEVVSSIPLEHLDVCIEIINYAIDVLGKRISSSIYISLTDHINFSLERYRTGIIFDNPLAAEVKSFYPKEYLIGEHAVAVIERKLGIRLPSDEASSVAMHFVNAEYNAAMSDTMHITKLIREIIEQVEAEFGEKIDELDINTVRFVSHLKFFAFCVFRGNREVVQDAQYNNMVISLYPEAYSLVENIAIFMKNRYNYIMSVDEKVNMSIHIQRIRKIQGRE